MTKQELAQKIKTKYPQYKDEDDNTLADKILAKYPVYQSQITDSATPLTPTAPAEEKNTFANNPLTRAFEESGQKRAKNLQDISDANRRGEQGFARSAFQVGGELVGGVIADPVMNVLKAVAPGLVKKLGEAGNEITKNLEKDEFINWLSNNPKFQEFAMSPAAKPLERDIKAINEYMALLAPGKGKAVIEAKIPAVLDPIATAVDKGTDGLKNIAQKPGEIIQTVKTKAGEIAEQKLAEPIPKPVENTLKETNLATFDEYANAAQKATESYKNPTPLEIAGTKAQDALDTIQRKMKEVGRQKNEILSRSAYGDKPVGSIVVRFRQNLNNFLKGKTGVEGDTKLVRDIATEAQKLGPNPTASQVDKFIDFVQEKIYTDSRNLTIPVTDSTTASLRRITGELNEALKSQLPPNYRTLNQKFSEMIDVRNELNTKLGKEGERGGALMKRVFSPSDANTKALFEQVKKLTNVDLVNEATLARFLMETVGDARQASLLEQLSLPRLSNLSQKGLLQLLIDKGFDKLLKNINSPEAKINRARDTIKP